MWRQVCFVQTHILIKTNHRSIWYPSQSSFFSLILFIRIFWIPFFELNSAAITCLYVTDSDASLVFHIQSRIKSKEFKWVISPNMYRNEYIYICLHRHTQISMNFFQLGSGWVEVPHERLHQKNVGWTVRCISKLIQCVLNVLVRIHLGHKRQNWAHDDLCFTGYPEWASLRGLVAMCGMKLWCSLITILVQDSGETIDLAKSCACLHILLLRQAGNWDWFLNNKLMRKCFYLSTCFKMEEHTMSYHSHFTMAAFA